jgi:hypothetical protein
MVLTTSNCVHDIREASPKKASDSYFVFGSNDLRKFDDDAQKVQVDEFILHPDWNPRVESYAGNIALARMQSKVEFNEFVQPVCLPLARNDHRDILNKEGLSAGWGNPPISLQII